MMSLGNQGHCGTSEHPKWRGESRIHTEHKRRVKGKFKHKTKTVSYLKQLNYKGKEK